MDSCHLFNFLFGTKKMTTELSKCFSSMGATTKKSRGQQQSSSSLPSTEAGSSKGKMESQSDYQTPPPSPLKQFQQRIVASLTNPVANSRKIPDNDQSRKILKTSCDSNCGTYRATLVESLPDDELQQFELEQTVDIVANPSHESRVSFSQSTTSSQHDIDNTDNKPDKQQQYNINKTSLVLVEPIQTQPSQVAAQPTTDILNYHKRIHETNSSVANNSKTITTDTENQASTNKQITMTTKCKRVILYDDSDPSQEQRQIVASSAEVYNMVSEPLGDRRARLRSVGSLSIHHQVDNNNNNLTKEEDNTDLHLKQAADAENCDRLRDKRNVYVRSLVQSIESNNSFESTTPTKTRSNSMDQNNNNNNLNLGGFTKPVTIVKPMPPKTPPKTIKAKCLNIQLNLNKPTKIQQLFQNETFLLRLFSHLDPLGICAAAQVCRTWRNILYADQNYWKDLVMVVDCTQIRREHLVDCILNTLQSAKLKHHKTITGSDSLTRLVRGVRSSGCARFDQLTSSSDYYSASSRCLDNQSDSTSSISEIPYDRKQNNSFVYDFDLEDVWRIQELCNRYTQRSGGQPPVSGSQQIQSSDSNASNQQQQQQLAEQQQQQQKQICTASKSSSIPSQISSTLSSVSLSSLLSPLSESSRIDSLKEKLYVSMNNRGFDSLCLFGATNEDIEDLISKTPAKTHQTVILSRFNNCGITNSGLELFAATFNQLEELELSGCNEINNSFDLSPLVKLKRLIITDCINIADGLAQKLVQIFGQLEELTLQAYHLTDAFLDYLSLNADTSKLKHLGLPNCKEITNQSLVTIAKHFSQLEALSVSGSTKISDEGVEILAEQARKIKILDLSWCSRITDASLECIACDLGDTLTDLTLDRNIHFTDIGLGYLATMSKLKLLHIRWCPRVTDVGLESVIAIKSLRYLSLAGIHQITARSLLCLADSDLLEVELTNCPAVNNDLALFLSEKMPNCNIIF